MATLTQDDNGARLRRLPVAAGTDESEQKERNQMSEIEIETVRCTLVEALRLLRSLHADIEAMRDNGEDYYGEFPDYRTNERGVSVEWPNLALMSDEVEAFLANKTVRELTATGRIESAVRELKDGEMFRVGKVKVLDATMREVGKVLEEAHPWGYRSEESEP